MKRHRMQGFTLIELVVVIVILGILAATAAPKFMDIQKDARIAKLEGLKGAIRSAQNMTRSKAVIAGLETKDAPLNGTQIYVCESGSATDTCNASNGIAISHGYPAASAAGLLKALDLDAVQADDSNVRQHDWAYRIKDWGNGKGQILIAPSEMPVPEQYQSESPVSGCFIFYDHPYMESSVLKKQLIVVTDEC